MEALFLVGGGWTVVSFGSKAVVLKEVRMETVTKCKWGKLPLLKSWCIHRSDCFALKSNSFD